MTVKIDGTNGIDTAQLRAPDGDPVALTIDALGKVAFPAQGQSLAGNGYIKLPGGLIIQWGVANANNTGVVVAYATPFIVAPMVVVATVESITLNQSCQISGKTNSGFNLLASASVPVNWIAIGN